MTYLRNNGIFTPSDYVGKPIEEAKKYAEDGGFIVRIVEEDGKAHMLTMEVKTNRLNFRIKQGHVSDVYGG